LPEIPCKIKGFRAFVCLKIYTQLYPVIALSSWCLQTGKKIAYKALEMRDFQCARWTDRAESAIGFGWCDSIRVHGAYLLFLCSHNRIKHTV